MREAHLGKEAWSQSAKTFIRDWLGHSAHLWMWDYQSLSTELAKVGFSSIRHASFGDSKEVRFSDVEDPGRWEGNLGIECIK